MQPIVNGATRLLFIVGDPIAQVRSPLIYNPKIEAHGKNCILVPLLVPQQEFEQSIPAIMRLGNLEGLIITFPFKERIMPFIRHISADAALIGAVNAVKLNEQGEWCGDIFDGIGMIRAVQALGQTITVDAATIFDNVADQIKRFTFDGMQKIAQQSRLAPCCPQMHIRNPHRAKPHLWLVAFGFGLIEPCRQFWTFSIAF